MKNDKDNEAFVLYNTIVNKYKKKYGVKNTYYADQIDPIGKKLFGDKWMGVYAQNTVPIKIKPNSYLITNLDFNSSPGSHWVALYKNHGTVYVYDSYARNSKNILPHLLKKLRKNKVKVIDSDKMDAEQAITANNCAIRCLSFLTVVKLLGIKKALHI